jgi:hypothetical protein
MRSTNYNSRFPAKGWLFLNFSVSLLLLTINARAQQPDMSFFTVLRLNEVNSYAAKHLLTNFSASTDVKWFREKNHYIAVCKEGDSTDRMTYKLNGNFENCIKYYSADALDRNVKSSVLKKFPGCKILVVTELTNLEKEELFIKIKDGSYIRTAHVSDEGMEITENILDVASRN